MGLFGKKSKEPKVAVVGGDGSYSYSDVVGESRYRDNLKALIAKASQGERDLGEVYTQAVLVPEPSNVFDSNAIQVFIGGLLVGYIAKESTGEMHRAIAKVRKAGFDQLACGAVIGWSTTIADPAVGVRLDLTQA